ESVPRHGSTVYVVGSGRKYMSDCSIRLNPRIDEPSNISSLSSAFSSSSNGMETFLTAPYGSVNWRRMNATSSRRQRSMTSCLSMTLLVRDSIGWASLSLAGGALRDQSKRLGYGLDE